MPPSLSTPKSSLVPAKPPAKMEGIEKPSTHLLLEPDGSYIAMVHIDAATTKRLMKRTGRASVEDQLLELPNYIDRLCQQRLMDECY